MSDDIHEVDGHFVISGDGTWLPGCYESREAASYAFRFCVDLQAQLRNHALEYNDGVITLLSMQRMNEVRGFSCGQGAHRAGWKEGDPIVFEEKT